MSERPPEETPTTDSAAPFERTSKKELEEINLAIKKLEEGSYGVCEMCKCEIPVERLKVIPYAKFCTHCREIDERKKKNHVMSEEND